MYGSDGACTIRVLQALCPKYRLHCQKASVKQAMEAIVKKRPVVATFCLTKEEWEAFCRFYATNVNGVLTADEINVRQRREGAVLTGNAVVLTSYNSKCLTLMNSWGSSWGDMGFFRVKNAEVLRLEFIDVFWTLNDLTKGEKAYHKEHGSKVAGKLMASLKGLQKTEYKCPKCNKISLVTEFTGTLTEAKCPKCSRQFSACDNKGNILALNMYLTSLRRRSCRVGARQMNSKSKFFSMFFLFLKLEENFEQISRVGVLQIFSWFTPNRVFLTIYLSKSKNSTSLSANITYIVLKFAKKTIYRVFKRGIRFP
jgi:DNA-directed RNA polymerase subunit RPC12/RpoP